MQKNHQKKRKQPRLAYKEELKQNDIDKAGIIKIIRFEFLFKAGQCTNAFDIVVQLSDSYFFVISVLYFKSMSMTATLAITFGCAFLTALFSLLVIVPWIKSKINEQMKDEQSTPSRSRSRSQSLLQRREDDQLSTEAIEMNSLAKG